jgi:hypothetical protein
VQQRGGHGPAHTVSRLNARSAVCGVFPLSSDDGRPDPYVPAPAEARDCTNCQRQRDHEGQPRPAPRPQIAQGHCSVCGRLVGLRPQRGERAYPNPHKGNGGKTCPGYKKPAHLVHMAAATEPPRELLIEPPGICTHKAGPRVRDLPALATPKAAARRALVEKVETALSQVAALIPVDEVDEDTKETILAYVEASPGDLDCEALLEAIAGGDIEERQRVRRALGALHVAGDLGTRALVDFWSPTAQHPTPRHALEALPVLPENWHPEPDDCDGKHDGKPPTPRELLAFITHNDPTHRDLRGLAHRARGLAERDRVRALREGLGPHAQGDARMARDRRGARGAHQHSAARKRGEGRDRWN